MQVSARSDFCYFLGINNAARSFDRLTYIDTLKEAGIDETSARAHANALDAAMRDGLATKPDMLAIDKAFVSVERRFVAIDQRFVAIDHRFEAMDAKIDALDLKFETKLDSLDRKIDHVETSLRGEIKTFEATLRSEIWQSANRTVMWLGGTMIALSSIVLAVLKLGH